MKYLLVSVLMSLLMMGLIVNEAYAKRFGGGRSFGVQRSQSALFGPKQSYSSPMAQRPNSSKWGGLIGGMLIGGLLASLFMGHGLAAGVLSWLAIGFVILLIVGFLRSRAQPGFQSSHSGPGHQFFNAASMNPFATQTQYQPSGGTASYPAGFSAEEFLREAKVKFRRLQAAYDEKNLQDLRAFTAPEVFAEIQMQLDERSDAPNKTDVIQLEAELLDVSKQVDSSIASVRFTGKIQENDEPAIALDEVWHFRQFSPNGEWVVGGVQQ